VSAILQSASRFTEEVLVAAASVVATLAASRASSIQKIWSQMKLLTISGFVFVFVL
jgi:hypothetical protein